MLNMKFLKLGIAASILGLGALESASVAAQDVIAVADGINMWDGQWHFESSMNAWIPWLYNTINLPAAAGGGTETQTIQPSQYVKHIHGGILLEASVRKGDWSLWTDLVFLNLQASPSKTKHIGLPGGDATLPVNLSTTFGLKEAIWTLAPTYTVLNNDVGTLDVLAGIRYTSLRVSFAYEFTAPPTPLAQGGGIWPTWDSTDGIVGVKGSLKISHDGRWFAPYEADAGYGNKNWQWNAILGVGYHFRWGDTTLGVRNITYNRSGQVQVEKVRDTGPLLAATFRF